MSVPESVAIIGTGCRFPGGSSNPAKLWELLREPKDLSKTVPWERFNVNGFYHANHSLHGTTNITNAYCIEEDFRHFDARFFQTKTAEVFAMDPQQRILLETVYEAVEASGQRLEKLRGTNTAVFVGVMGGDFHDLKSQDLDSMPTYMSTGTARSILSNRISYFFDWHGPSMTIDTACSSSLVALHQGVQALQNHTADVSVVAGANLILAPHNFIAESKLGMLSPTGHCRMWDASADGYARGDGFAAVILKRLDDAIEDGDDIECIIRGSGVNQDGRTRGGITIPSSGMQEALIRQVYKDSGLDITKWEDRCQYFEAHGTGTPAGDPMEAAAISGAFFSAKDRVTESIGPLYVGSVKTVIGHTEGTAGLAELLKASLAIRHGIIPPNLHLDRLNPAIEPFYKMLKVPTEATDWPIVPEGSPRRASINSFGFGGTNAHVILESYDIVSRNRRSNDSVIPLAPLVFSAPTHEDLTRSVGVYLEYLEAHPDIDFSNLVYTLACRRSLFECRASVGAFSRHSALADMATMVKGAKKTGTQFQNLGTRKILGVFTGQGAQSAEMGQLLISSSGIASNTISRLDHYLNELPTADQPTWSLRQLLVGTLGSQIQEAEFAQPLCTAVQIALVDVLEAARVKLAAVVGHSSGEIAAAYAAGHLSARDALYISYYRGLHSKLSKSPNGEFGAMMAVGTTLEDAQDLCDFAEMRGKLCVAAVNSEISITLSGDESAIATAKIVFEDEGKFARVLKVDKAYHSNHMDACADHYVAALAASDIKVKNGTDRNIPWFSSVYGRPVSSEHDHLENLYWKDNMIKPVLFSKAVSNAIQKEGPYAVAIEIGPHPALKEPTLQSMEQAGAARIPYVGMLKRGCNDFETVSNAFGAIWTQAGDDAVNFESLLSGEKCKPALLKDLPSYPWDHRRTYWKESRVSKAFRTRSKPVHELLGTMLPDGAQEEIRWRNLLSPKEVPWLRGHILQGSMVFPASAYIVMALDASLTIPGSSSAGTAEVRDLVIERAIVFDEEADEVETLFSLTDVSGRINQFDGISANFKCFAQLDQASSDLVMTARGKLRLGTGERFPPSPPLRNAPLSRTLAVDTERFYSALSEVGYEYNGPFRGLSAMERALGFASALIEPPPKLDDDQPRLVHPVTLDLAFQSLFCALCWPGDGTLSSLHVPREVVCVKIDINLARTTSRTVVELPVVCSLDSGKSGQIQGDIDLFLPQRSHVERQAIVQVEGISVVPVSPPTMADDRKLFEDVIWGPTEPKIQRCMTGGLEASLACLAAQVTFRYPHLRIIDVGNANGVTASILDEIQHEFRSYTVVRQSLDSLEVAKAALKRERIEFSTLDLQSEVLSQGFSANFYGLAVISSLGIEPDALEAMLHQLRHLLNPGAYLLLSFIFEAGLSTSSHRERHLDVSKCDSALRRAGFGGIDGISSIGEATVLISQAVDDQVLALRRPLEFTWTSTAAKDVAIICGSSQATTRAAETLKRLLTSHFRMVMLVEGTSISDVDLIPAGAAIISLSDLDEPVFRSLTASKLEGLKRLFNKSERTLWLTRGCLSEDPYSNMVVGFGRTLLLESPSLQIQFLDLASNLPIRPEIVAEAFLRLFSAIEFSTPDNKVEGRPVWTLEPELALTEGGDIIIPRILPSEERNLRYNSKNREITRSVVPGTSILEIEILEDESSFALLERSVPPTIHSSSNSNTVQIDVRHSCLLAIRIEKIGYLFPVLGHLSDNGRRVVTLSNAQTSHIAMPHGHYFPCPERISEDTEASHLCLVTAYLYAFSLFDEVCTGDVILFLEPPPALETALSHMAELRGTRINFLHSSLNTETISPKAHSPRILLHPAASSRLIKATLPPNVTMFISAAPSDFHTRISACLPRFHRHINVWTLISRIGYMVTPPLTHVDLESRLSAAVSYANGARLHETNVVGLGDIGQVPFRSESIDIVSWLSSQRVNVRLRPVDSESLFAQDKTYLLVGLVGDLGMSLTKWMVEHGAKYIVLTSRKPRIDHQWLEALENLGAVVRIFANDITNKSALKEVVEEVRKTLPPLAGVANGAMVLEDVAVAEMTVEKLQKVTEPKVKGSINLDELLGETRLDFFILFSSVAAVVGNRGQSSYSAANAFMCSLAARRRARGLAASVIHIGAIVGTGYLTREVGQGVQDYLRKAGYLWMSESDFHQVFAEGVLASPPTSGSSHEVMSGLNMEDYARNTAVWRNNPKFQHCVMGSDDPYPPESQLSHNTSLETKVASTFSLIEAHKVIRDAFLEMLRSTLLLESDARVLEENVHSIGIDSLVAVVVRTWFSKELEIDIPVMKILGAATVGSILEFAWERLQPRLPPTHQVHDRGDLASPSRTENALASPTQGSASGKPEQEILENPRHLVEDQTSIPVKTLPLSFSQSRFWFLQSFLEDKTSSNVTCLLSLKGALRVSDLDRAVKIVGDRHEGLRTSFVVRNDQPEQVVLEKSLLRLETKSITSEAEVAENFDEAKQYVFDLESGKTMRILLLESTPRQNFLIISYHHINMDGVSFSVLVADLAKAYSGAGFHHPVLQYPEFSERQRRSFALSGWRNEIAYWRREFAQLPPSLPVLPLSSLRTRKPLARYSFHKASSRLDGQTRSRVREVCREQTATAFHFYVTVFEILLARLAGLGEICIGVADSGRTEAEEFGSIGNYLNLLPLRLRPKLQQSFADALQESSSKVYSALANAAVPVDVLFAEIGVERSNLHTPLFQAFVDYRNVQETQKFGDCEISGQEYSVGRTGYDIVLDVIDNTVGETSLSIMVQDSLYTENGCRTLLESFIHLVSEFSNDSSTTLQTPDLYEPKSKFRALELAQGTEFHRQWDTLPHAVDAITCMQPSHIALKDGLGSVLTYQGMRNRVNCIASALLTIPRLVQGSRIAVFQQPGSDWVCSMLAIMKVGAVYVPLDLTYGMPRLNAIMKESCPSIVLTDSQTVDQADAFQATAMALNIDLISDELPPSDISISSNARSTAAILFTSGSTGTPKGIELSHGAIQNHVEGCMSEWAVSKEKILQKSPYGFDFSLFEMCLGLLTGGMVYVVPREMRGDAAMITKIIAAERISVVCGVPSELLSWLQYGERELMRRSKCTMMVSGGECFSSSLVHELRNLSKEDLRVMNMYGPTEATISATSFEVRYRDNAELLECGVPVGRPLPNYAVYILDQDLKPLPPGVPGQIAIAGPISSGYWGMDDLQKQRFLPDPFASFKRMKNGWSSMLLTGDCGRLRPKDGALMFEGRTDGDTQVKLRGFRIELEDVESNILAAAKGTILRAVCSAHGNPPEFLVAHVTLSPEHRLPTKEEQDEFLAQLCNGLPLPRYMLPAIIVSLEAMPYTVSGKLDRQAIAALPLPTPVHSKHSPSQRGLYQTESLLRQIWLSVLQSRSLGLDIDLDADFFHVGGNSLLIIGLAARIKDTFGIRLPVIQLFETSTLAKMAAEIDRIRGMQADDIEDDFQPTVDWVSETSPDGVMEHRPTSAHNTGICTKTPSGKVVVLTGATGFLGQHILSSLLANPSVYRIYCISVRNPAAITASFDDERVRVFSGTLGEPRLGLSQAEAQEIFQHTDVVIHNGADVSFLKTYASLRDSNLGSTKELVGVLLTNRCSHCSQPTAPAFHYVSTVGVSQLQQHCSDTFAPGPVLATSQHQDRLEGYAATKWASERFLERLVNAHTQSDTPAVSEGPLRVIIHRPSSITGSGAPRSLDIVQNILHYCRELRAVPEGLADVWHGWIDLVDVQVVADNIVRHTLDKGALSSDTDTKHPLYLHHSGDHEIPIAGLKDWLQAQDGTEMGILPSSDWIQRAVGLGLHEMVAEYMMLRDSSRRLFAPRILR